MARALHLAARGSATTFPNPRVGCVIAQGERVLGEGWHERAGAPHAEVHALRAAGAAARGATVYVSLEPCAHQGRTPPCADALIAAGVARVVAAMQDPDPRTAGAGLARLRDSGVEVACGLMQDVARALNRGFVSRLERGRPWLRLKLAMSLDGRTAMASGESQWISGPAARADVHRQRAEAGAVLTSAATVLTDDPRLTVRISGDWRQPDRVLLDRHARIPAGAAVWAPGARRLWLTRRPGPAPADVERLVVDADDAHWLEQALHALGAAQINSLLAECGPRLAGALLQGGLVDELLLYCAPLLLGGAARPLAELPGLGRLAEGPRLRYEDVRLIGKDLRLLARPEMTEIV